MSVGSRVRPFFSRKSSASIIAAFALASLLVSTPAQAREEKLTKGIPDSLRPCISQALASKAQQWQCTPDGLDIQVDSQGKARAAVPAALAPSPSALPSDQGQPIPDSAPAEVMPRAGGTDYDTWCENGTICRRTINSYIAEVKGNAAYGNSNGVIGSYDIVLRTNLNGRQANSSLSFIWDSGPSLAFYGTQITCTEYSTPRLNCGVHNAPALGVGPTKYRSDSGLIYGNRLNNSNTYVNFARTNFTPTGFLPYTAAPLETLDFRCLGNDNCYFP